MPAARIYVVAPKIAEAGKPAPRRLVRATHPANALRHVAEAQFAVAVASQDDLVALLGEGVKVEDIAAEQQQTAGLTSSRAIPAARGSLLNPPSQVLSLIREKPSRGIWWARQEAFAKGFATRESGDGWRFRTDRASYADMMGFAASQRDAFDTDEEAIACFCGD
jgi:hypothetical protein